MGLRYQEAADTEIGTILLMSPTSMLRDEMIGKLLHPAILLAMCGAGFSPRAIMATPSPVEPGGLVVSYQVHLTQEDLDRLPSIYDAQPAVKPAKRHRRKARRSR